MKTVEQIITQAKVISGVKTPLCVYDCKIYDKNGKVKKVVKGKDIVKSFWEKESYLYETSPYQESRTCELCKKKYMPKGMMSRYCVKCAKKRTEFINRRSSRLSHRKDKIRRIEQRGERYWELENGQIKVERKCFDCSKLFITLDLKAKRCKRHRS